MWNLPELKYQYIIFIHEFLCDGTIIIFMTSFATFFVLWRRNETFKLSDFFTEIDISFYYFFFISKHWIYIAWRIWFIFVTVVYLEKHIKSWSSKHFMFMERKNGINKMGIFTLKVKHFGERYKLRYHTCILWLLFWINNIKSYEKPVTPH